MELLLESRKLIQSVVIDDIKITILEAKRGYVEVGIEVTEDIKLHREVIYKKIVAESRQEMKVYRGL